ncbi:uncharacterized protein LOC135839065 isoform X1 [Planococcus citri]|uniref:uncharacterized protein LOC135839065 isoform X1 n=1 Tax=Planococcus citri TaxID=170843 RepID=UPI0031FA1167
MATNNNNNNNNNNPVNQNENPLVFYSSHEGTLQELACVVASAWCYCQMEKSKCRSVPSEIAEIASLPTVLRKMIKKCILKVKVSFRNWRQYLGDFILAHREGENFPIDFVSFVSWRADGSINEDGTAANLMQCDLLSQMEKYRFACMFCLVDDVKKLWPVEVDANDPLIEYWNYKMGGEQFTFNVDPELSCIEASLLLRNGDVNYSSAFEYLWGFLTDDEQVETVESITRKISEINLKCALPKLSYSQLERVMMSYAVNIFRVLWLAWTDDMLLSLLFDPLKNMITPDVFNEIIIRFLNYHGEKLAYEMWMRAPDELKNHLLVNNFKNLLNASIQEERLFLELLMTTDDVDTRSTIWREKWRNILDYVSLSYLKKIMKLCLSSENEIASFKRTHLSNYSSIERYCKRMVLRENFDELSESLQFFFDDPKIIFNLKKNILKSQYLLDHYTHTEFRRPRNMDSLVTFLNETFPDITERREFERDLIMSDESLAHFRSAMQNDCDLIDGIKRFVSNIISSDADLVSAKRMFWTLIQEMLISGDFKKFDRSSRNDFIKWCLHDDDDALDTLISSLRVN